MGEKADLPGVKRRVHRQGGVGRLVEDTPVDEQVLAGPERQSLSRTRLFEELSLALEVYEAGCSRFGATQTVSILEAWKAALVASRPAAAPRS